MHLEYYPSLDQHTCASRYSQTWTPSNPNTAPASQMSACSPAWRLKLHLTCPMLRSCPVMCENRSRIKLVRTQSCHRHIFSNKVAVFIKWFLIFVSIYLEWHIGILLCFVAQVRGWLRCIVRVKREEDAAALNWLIFVLYSLLTFSKGCCFIFIIASRVLLHSVCCPDKGEKRRGLYCIIEDWRGLHLISVGRSEITGGLLCTFHFVVVFLNPKNKNGIKNLISLLYFYYFINATKHNTLIL